MKNKLYALFFIMILINSNNVLASSDAQSTSASSAAQAAANEKEQASDNIQELTTQLTDRIEQSCRFFSSWPSEFMPIAAQRPSLKIKKDDALLYISTDLQPTKEMLSVLGSKKIETLIKAKIVEKKPVNKDLNPYVIICFRLDNTRRFCIHKPYKSV